MKGLIVASLFVAGTAAAQAPGEVYESEPVAPPGMAPVVAQPQPQPPPPPPPPKDRRWSVGLGIGSLSLAPHHQPDNSSDFSLGMIALRWRPFRHLELELALSGGGTSEDSYEQREVSQGVFALRWRFNPQAKWNLWAMAGMGSLTVTDTNYGEGVQQSTLQFGLGLERRWNRFALQLEGRLVGVAPPEEEDVPPMADVRQPGQPTPPYESTPMADGWKGGQLVLSGNFYF